MNYEYFNNTGKSILDILEEPPVPSDNLGWDVYEPINKIFRFDVSKLLYNNETDMYFCNYVAK